MTKKISRRERKERREEFTRRTQRKEEEFHATSATKEKFLATGATKDIFLAASATKEKIIIAALAARYSSAFAARNSSLRSPREPLRCVRRVKPLHHAPRVNLFVTKEHNYKKLFVVNE